MSYLVRKQRDKKKVFLPGSDQFFVEFCEFNRRGRDEYDRDRHFGGADFVDTLLRHGISDFLLPGDDSTYKYTGTDDDFRLVYNDLNEDLETWMTEGVCRINQLRRSDGTLIAPANEDEDQGSLGNSPGSPAEPSEVSEVQSSEPATQEQEPQ